MSPLIDPKRSEKLIKGAGTAGISFAFGVGDSPATSVLAVDKSKSGKSLFQLCKEDGGAKKGSFGTIRYINGFAILDCEKDELSDLVKSMTGYLRHNKIGLNVELFDESSTENTKEKQKRDEKEKNKDEYEEDDDDEDMPANKMLDADIIISLIRKAKNKILPFSFGIGPNISLMAAHPKKSPTQLAKILRQEGVKKGVWGTVKTDGKTAIFTCEAKPFSSLKNEIKAWLADNKQTLKFRIEGPGGYVDEDKDGDDDKSSEDSVLAFVRSDLASLKPKLMEAIAKQPGRKAELQTLWKLAEDAGKSGNRQKAEMLISKLAASATEALPPQRSDLAGVIAAWKSERSTAVSNIGIFSDKVREAYKYDHEQKEQVNAILKKLGALQAKISRGLVSETDELRRSSSPEHANRLKKAANDFLHAIRSDELLRSLDDSFIWPDANIAARLIKETEKLHSAF